MDRHIDICMHKNVTSEFSQILGRLDVETKMPRDNVVATQFFLIFCYNKLV